MFEFPPEAGDAAAVIAAFMVLALLAGIAVGHFAL